jgi:hydrogenase nickel incorporation protein HypB
MCADCGCGTESGTRLTRLDRRPHDHGDERERDQAPDHHADHDHDHEHHAEHEHGRQPVTATSPGRTITIEQAVLAKNDRRAEQNRAWLAGRGITAVNLMSSPGSGKTTLLERTVRDLGAVRPVSVIEGDQETLLDAERIQATGCRVVQINTGAGCHLDAAMLADGLAALDPPAGCLLFIENVGNLVCPALFDLGERGKVVIISVTEGDDKPLKYPQMFAAADVVLINKIDLLPHVDFDLAACAQRARSVNPGLELIPLSAKTGAGLPGWYDWLQREAPEPGDAHGLVGFH